ncbi:MAG TPA: hypothetical protein EYQ27_08330, partial [Gemmatimonadetes bacterium]|nr:hypothetical protein [Gemmatimonadota bacterium]
MDNPLFDSLNTAYAQAMFEEYARNPEGVPAEWRSLFETQGERAVAEGLFVPDQLNDNRPAALEAAPLPPSPSSQAADHLRRALPVVSRATALVQAFRDHGHQLARVDPLGSEPAGHPQLTPAFFGTSMEELAELPASLVMDEVDADRSVADALSDLEDIYAGSIGYEFEHLDDHVKVDWLWEQVESRGHLPEMSPEEKRALLYRLSEVEGMEQFIHRAYLGQKRFSLEGTDALVPMLDLAIELAARKGG